MASLIATFGVLLFSLFILYLHDRYIGMMVAKFVFQFILSITFLVILWLILYFLALKFFPNM
ncbi:MAG TPA: hypothetical protein DD761_03410 [Cyanobacteria bacterium UBA11691]|nr:hypothetical protein [Cyanobacteria bacterium UBA11691]